MVFCPFSIPAVLEYKYHWNVEILFTGKLYMTYLFGIILLLLYVVSI